MWFLDFRVLPLENRAKEVLTSYGWFQSNERTRLMPESGQTQQSSSLLQRYMDSTGETASISCSNFYSPLATPEQSDDDDSLEGDAMDHRNRKIANVSLFHSMCFLSLAVTPTFNLMYLTGYKTYDAFFLSLEKSK